MAEAVAFVVKTWCSFVLRVGKRFTGMNLVENGVVVRWHIDTASIKWYSS